VCGLQERSIVERCETCMLEAYESPYGHPEAPGNCPFRSIACRRISRTVEPGNVKEGLRVPAPLDDFRDRRL